MIKTFTVENYKGFKEQIVLDLSKTHDYKFHQEALKNGIANKTLLFGRNGSGKSNLGRAIMDISRHLTKNLVRNEVGVFPNLERIDDNVKFSYLFSFDGDELEYSYEKNAFGMLAKERMSINGKRVLEADFVGKNSFLELPGSETLDISIFDYSISLALYVFSRSGFIKNGPFDHFFDFVNRMLSFRSLKENEFEGFQSSGKPFADVLLEHGKEPSLRGLENLLRKEGIDYKLDIVRDLQTNSNIIVVKQGKCVVPLHSIWSTGTSSLVLFYCWLLDLKKTSFLFIDEFDAFYHYELAEDVFSIVAGDPSYQCILTTHNCSLMSNKLTRPDCCFVISQNKTVKNLAECTSREIREGHNLENLYKNGAFCE